jgi:hypothetical protein
MARVTFASIVADVSGSVGSATFQKSLYGNTLRTKPRTGKKGTPSQLLSRATMQACQYAWQALSVADRRQWDQFIGFSGASIKRDRNILLTGHALFIKYNFARLISGYAILNNPTYISSPAWPTLDHLYVSGTALFATYSDILGDLDIWATLFVSTPRLPSQSFSRVNLRFLSTGFVAGAYIRYNDIYVDLFGAICAVGQTLDYQLQFFSELSPILSFVKTGSITVEAFP